MIILKSFSFYLAILGILLAVAYSNFTGQELPIAVGVQNPSTSPFDNFISAAGIVESTDKNIEVGSPEEGLVEKLWFSVGESVKEGDALFQVDSRALEAKLDVQKSQVEVAKATLEKQEGLFERIKTVQDPRSISKEDYQVRENEMKVAEAQLKTAMAEQQQTEKLIDRLTVRAPKDGVILQQNIRVGEYISKNSPALILGDLEHLQLRVDIDEQNANKFSESSLAVAFPKNNKTEEIPLTFVRIEPYVIPKRSLTGQGEERVDTRVLQVIYSFDHPKNYRMYVGLQADVFIEKKER